MSALRLAELLERTIVIVAHQDDECVGAGGLLQRMRCSLVVFCTNGAPLDPGFWEAYGKREKYLQVRRQEAAAAANVIGTRRPIFLPITDQELYLKLHAAHRGLQRLVRKLRPQAILTHAYEGGHPDHDCCAFLGHAIGTQQQLPVWEMPLYHLTNGGPIRQEFLVAAGASARLRLTPQELARKQKMASLYTSQKDVLTEFDLEVEAFRPQPPYDFLNPPAETINYEAWRWPITAQEVCRAFASFERQSGLSSQSD